MLMTHAIIWMLVFDDRYAALFQGLDGKPNPNISHTPNAANDYYSVPLSVSPRA